MHPVLLHFGHFVLPTRGVCVAVGLVVALLLSGRVGRAAKLDPDSMWDVGFFMTLATLVASRVLVVLANFKAFLHYPLLVLSLPTVSAAGLLLAGLITLLYVRWKGLPVLQVMDAGAVCGAVVLVFVHIGDLFSGDDVGLATTSWFGKLLRGQGVFAAVGLHPVALYAAAGSAMVFAVLMWWMPHRGQAGEVFGAAVFLLAVVRFWVDCYRVESMLDLKTPWDLDPDQVVMLAVMAIGAAFWLRWPEVKKKEMTHAV